jgi:hypothetical protein
MAQARGRAGSRRVAPVPRRKSCQQESSHRSWLVRPAGGRRQRHQLFCKLALFGFFCTIMPFAVSFQKMDPMLGAIIIGAEHVCVPVPIILAPVCLTWIPGWQ